MAKGERYRVVETAWKEKGRQTVAVMSDWISEREARKKLREVQRENPSKLFSLEKQ